ncbi:cupin-like domain-containing protein [Chitinimonas sp. BJYL2]|uniref:cupin-like domain-containing protein n=1 Tax=Chitinimonas sp. BJYL2 TaxID=2976696 RepID=UPI0022B3B04D|nr:cupin-like domain-containing protein [Chitinimonas sp. BJYL2]
MTTATRVPVDNEWRRWIAENLILDGEPASLLHAMVGAGIAPDDARREIETAMASPYLAGAGRLRERLKKRSWVLDIQRKLNHMDTRMQAVPRRHKLSADELYHEFYLLNRPVVITGMLDDWPAREHWTNDYFRTQFGEREVEVQFGRNQDANYEINQPHLKRRMRFGELVDLIERSGETNDFYMTANNTGHNKQALSELWNDTGHLPEYLNGVPGEGFFWFGPAGTRTPMHHDLTNNFMAQIRGRKLVRLVPAVEQAQVYNHLHCYTPVDAANIDLQRFPAMAEAQVLDVVLEAGEILFLPVGCWHYVQGLDVSITMSYTNFRWDNDFSSFYSTYHGV